MPKLTQQDQQRKQQQQAADAKLLAELELAAANAERWLGKYRDGPHNVTCERLIWLGQVIRWVRANPHPLPHTRVWFEQVHQIPQTPLLTVRQVGGYPGWVTDQPGSPQAPGPVSPAGPSTRYWEAHMPVFQTVTAEQLLADRSLHQGPGCACGIVPGTAELFLDPICGIEVVPRPGYSE